MPRFPWKVSTAALLGAVALAWSAPQAAAQYGESKKIEITPFGGWYIASDLYTTVGSQIGINNSVIYGGRIGIFPNARLGIEGSYSRASSDLEVRDSSPGFPGTTPLGTLTVNIYEGNLVFTQPKLGNPRATGFFTIGAGSTTFDADVTTAAGSGSASRSHFTWNIGIGSKYEMSEKVSLRLDGRYRAADTDINTSAGVYCDIYGFCYSYSSSWYDSGEISAGLTYKLGN